MKQGEKSGVSRNRILSAAVKEFGGKSFDSASLNNICSESGISKGLIYHHFGNKDELYLQCVKACFAALTQHMDSGGYVFTDFQRDISHYLDLRQQFFRENPEFAGLFFQTVLRPPAHLKTRIKDIRKDFDSQCARYFRSALGSITLRDDLTEDEAMEYFFIFMEMLNGYFEREAQGSADFDSLIEAHEIKLSKLLNIMIYGIAQNGGERGK